MPIYEYECQKCKKVHEKMQKFSDPPLKKCPECGSKVEKLMSLSSFALKGEGWYTTDYKRKKEEKPKKESSSEPKEKKETKKSKPKTETSTEKK